MANTEVATTPSANNQTVRTQMVAVRDTQLYVEHAGEGPTLLFIHGMCGDAHVWHGQVRRLSPLCQGRVGHAVEREI